MAAFTTVALLGLTALKAVSQVKQSEAEAKAAVAQGEFAAKTKAKETKLKAARAQSSFLTSGLTLEGTPMAAIQDIFSTGLEDVEQIATNVNRRSKNIISSGRTAALGTLASGIGGSFGGGDIFGDSAGGFTVPFTGSGSTISAGGSPIPGVKPTRIQF